MVGPELKLQRGGSPKKMALELFKPSIYVIDAKGLSGTVKQSKRMVEGEQPAAWDILDEVICEHPVLLERAPTLHRLGIQASSPRRSKARRSSCTLWSARPSTPTSTATRWPSTYRSRWKPNWKRVLMMSTNNLSPANCSIIVPSQDIVLGLYYLSLVKDGEPGEGKAFADLNELDQALDAGVVTLHSKIRCRYSEMDADGNLVQKVIETSPGRMKIASLFPRHPAVGHRLLEKNLTKKEIGNLIDIVYRHLARRRRSSSPTRSWRWASARRPWRASRSARTTSSSRPARRRSSPRPASSWKSTSSSTPTG